MHEAILISDDDADVRSALRYLLQTEGYEVEAVASPAEALSALKKKNFSVLLADLNYSKDTTSGQEGLELISKVSELDSLCAIVAMTAWGSIETAVKAMQAGARDFVLKPWENERLLAIVANQIRLNEAERKSLRLSEENKLLRDELQPANSEIIWKSAAMQSVMSQLDQVAPSDANILFTGENGTGKSFLVNYVHAHSQRSDAPLIKVNMGSITETLFESEMFGHIKGAFTDAREDRIGRFELAEGGTLFLDEIANTPVSQQAKLLRVLEERQFERVGSSQTRNADCRLISATNGDLEAAVDSGEFRKDLLYRINTITIDIPPLRQRSDDILPLADYFIDQHCKKYNRAALALSGSARSALQSYSWPGNVRELANTLERATVLATDSIGSELLGLSTTDTTQEGTAGNNFSTLFSSSTLDEIEKRVIQDRLQAYEGNSLEVADTLGLSKSAFYRHLKKHGIK